MKDVLEFLKFMGIALAVIAVILFLAAGFISVGYN